jgi:hypothetical protein
MFGFMARLRRRYETAYAREIERIEAPNSTVRRQKIRSMNIAGLVFGGALWGAALGIYVVKGHVSYGLMGAASAMIAVAAYFMMSGRFPLRRGADDADASRG